MTSADSAPSTATSTSLSDELQVPATDLRAWRSCTIPRFPPIMRLPPRLRCPSRPACYVQRGLEAARASDRAMNSARTKCQDHSMPGTTLCTQRNRRHHFMTPFAWLLRRSVCFAMAMTMAVALWGCGNVPRQYVRMAEPGVTLTQLIADPDSYRGIVVLLGGTIIEAEENEQDLWLHVINRPLDQDYIPRRPPSMDGPEASSYWVVATKQQFPHQYRQWARVTVVGQVTGMQRYGTEPVLSLLYVRGWELGSTPRGVWDYVNPNYIPSSPLGVRRN